MGCVVCLSGKGCREGDPNPDCSKHYRDVVYRFGTLERDENCDSLTEILASNASRDRENRTRSQSRPPNRERSRPPAPALETPTIMSSPAPMTPPNWEATPSPTSPPEAYPTQHARGATRELGPRAFELKFEPGAGDTLSKAIRRSSQSRKNAVRLSQNEATSNARRMCQTRRSGQSSSRDVTLQSSLHKQRGEREGLRLRC